MSKRKNIVINEIEEKIRKLQEEIVELQNSEESDSEDESNHEESDGDSGDGAMIGLDGRHRQIK